jgi:hypothetical protein
VSSSVLGIRKSAGIEASDLTCSELLLARMAWSPSSGGKLIWLVELGVFVLLLTVWVALVVMAIVGFGNSTLGATGITAGDVVMLGVVGGAIGAVVITGLVSVVGLGGAMTMLMGRNPGSGVINRCMGALVS